MDMLDGWVPDILPVDQLPQPSDWDEGPEAWAANRQQALARWVEVAASWDRILDGIRQDYGGEHPYADWVPHRKQAMISYATLGGAGPRELYLHWCNRGGKTNFGAQRDAFVLLGFPPSWFLAPERIPYLWALPWPRGPKPWQLIIVTPNADAREKGVTRYLLGDESKGIIGFLPSSLVLKVSRDNSSKRRVDGIDTMDGQCAMLSQGQDIGAAMSVDVDRIHEDEELAGPSGDHLRGELAARTTDRLGTWESTFTGVDSAIRGGNSKVMTECIKPALLGTLRPEAAKRIRAWTGTIWENTHLSREEQEEHSNKFLDKVTGKPGWEYELRVNGNPVGANLSPVVNPAAILHQQQFIRPPETIGTLHTSVDFRQGWGHEGVPAWAEAPVRMLQPKDVTYARQDNGLLQVWRKPYEGGRYTVGADSGHGHVGRNPSAAAVFDRLSGEFVALLWGTIGIDDFTRLCVMLCTYYNRAWMCPENGGPGTKMVDDLIGLHTGTPLYDRLYYYTRTGGGDVDKKHPGYPTAPAPQTALHAQLNRSLVGPGDDATLADVRVPISRVLTEWNTWRVMPNGKVVYPEFREGDILTHGDAGVAAALALEAHHSPCCPMPASYPQRAVLLHKPSETLLTTMEREIDKYRAAQERRTGGWSEDGGFKDVGRFR